MATVTLLLMTLVLLAVLSLNVCATWRWQAALCEIKQLKSSTNSRQ